MMVEKEIISQPGRLSRDIVQGVVLMLAWVLMSGRMDAFHLGAGVLGVLGLTWLDRRLGGTSSWKAVGPLHPAWGKILLYGPWLWWQMILSSWQVGRVIWRRSVLDHIDPELVRFRSAQPNQAARVVLANSITLTPGTLTLRVDGNSFLVHALTKGTRKSLLDGAMQQKVGALFSVDLDQEAVTNGYVLTGGRVK